MNYPDELKYTKDHEWIKSEGDTIIVGITDYAQDALGDIVFVELPDTGGDLDAGATACVIESVKSVSDVYAPLKGTITEVNELLESQPESINKSPYGDGWLFKMKLPDKSKLDGLLTADEYQQTLGQ